MFEVQSPQEFLNDFIQHANHAKKRIYLQSMLFETGKALDVLEPVLLQKARAGVKVQVTIDWISQHFVHDNPLLLPQINPKKRTYTRKLHEENARLIQRWEEAGVVFVWTNQAGLATLLLPVFRRNHTKLYVVDDTCWLGGINLFDLAFTWMDIMVRYNDAAIVTAVCKHIAEVNENRPSKNYSVKTGETEILLCDTGTLGKSLILDETIKAAKKATKALIFVSQFVPEGKLLFALIKAAERGVRVTVVTSPRTNHLFTSFPYNIPYRTFLTLTKNKPNIKVFYQKTKVHAKLLIVDETIALFGSHNMITTGVMLGTEEVAVRTEDTKLIHALLSYLEEHTNIPR